MRLTINGRTGDFSVPDRQVTDTFVVQHHSLPSMVLEQHPAIGSRVMLTPQQGEDNIHWLSILWQLKVLKDCRPDLKLILQAPFSAPSWQRLLSALDLSCWPPLPNPARGARLTLTESRVLLMLLGGIHPQQLAFCMKRDMRTVSSHKKRAMEKIGLRHNGELYMLGALLYGQCQTIAIVNLPPAERQVLAGLLCNGSVTVTAKLLGKSVKTVSCQKQNIMRRFGVPHEVALFAAAG